MIRNKTKWAGLLAVVVATLLGVAACEDQDFERTFQGPYFVRFTDTVLTYKESYNKPIAIRVHNAGPQLAEPITVTYTISGSARKGRDYTVEGTEGTVTIPANQSFGTINLRLINNANNILETQNLVFTLTGVQPASLQVGFGKEGIVGKNLRFTIQDECLLSGSYTGVWQLGNQTVSVPDIPITNATADCKQYTLTNWNIGLFDLRALKPTLTFIDNGDNSLTIPAQVSDFLAAPYDTIRGTGSWNPQTRRISLNIRLKTQNQAQRDTTVIYALTYIPQ